MGTGASKPRRGVSASRYVAEEASNASEDALKNAFTELSDAERQRVMKALQTVPATAEVPDARRARPHCPTEAEAEVRRAVEKNDTDPEVRGSWLVVFRCRLSSHICSTLQRMRSLLFFFLKPVGP